MQTREESQLLYDQSSKYEIRYYYTSKENEQFFNRRGSGSLIANLYYQIYKVRPKRHYLEQIHRYYTIGDDPTKHKEFLSKDDIYWTLYFDSMQYGLRQDI